MAIDPFNQFNQDPLMQDLGVTNSSIHGSQIGQSNHDLTQNQSTIHNNRGNVTHHFGNIFNILPPFEAIKGALVSTSNWFRNMLPEAKHEYSNIGQLDANYLRRIEQIAHERLELEKVDSSRRSDAAEKIIQLQIEETRLQNERFLWEKEVVEENLRIIKQSQAMALEKRREELQMQTDMHYLPLQVSRGDVLELLSQESGKFVVIPSPPEILNDVQVFKSLKVEIQHSLQDTIKKYYCFEGAAFPIGYKNIFNEWIDDSHATLVGKFIAPIPTLIFHSKVAHQKIFIWITVTCPVATVINLDSLENGYIPESYQIPLQPLNWMDLKREFELCEQDSERIHQGILDLIATIYTVVAMCFSDLYCLNLNPYHRPKLFEFLEASEFSNTLRLWTEPFQNYLLETQKKIQEELNRIHEVEPEEIKQSYSPSSSYTNSNDFEHIPLIVCGLGIIVLIAMCSQQRPNASSPDISRKNPIEQGQNRVGVIQVNRPSENAARLRATPELDGKVISELPNGTRIVLGEVSGDGQWQQVTTQDGKIGWVWAEFVQ